MLLRPVDVGVYVRGFALARDRFEAAGGEWERGFRGLLEAVAWAGTVRERQRQHDCDELDGLWFVRNLMLHVGGDALLQAVVSHGTVLGTWVLGVGRLGMQDVHEWRWRSRAELPRTISGAGTDAYDEHLDGRPVADTLSAVARYFATIT